MSYVPPTDWELKDFFRAHVDAVYRSCNFLTGGRADTQTMVRDIFLKMLAKGMYFNSEREARAWMILTAYKMAPRAMKKAADIPADQAFPQEIMNLSRKDRLVALLYYCEGYRRSEIANCLGCTSMAVSRRLKRLKKRISDVNEPDNDEIAEEAAMQSEPLPQTIRFPAPVPQTEEIVSSKEEGDTPC